MSGPSIVLVIVAALWVAQTVAILLWGLPRAAQLWQWEGYWLGRRDEKAGAPVPARMQPPREKSRHG